ncbi:multiple inositol polyphosphate phosphatase 1-like [Styela clava]
MVCKARVVECSIFVVLAMCYFSNHANGFCSSDFDNDDEYPYKYYQTKTLYTTTRGDISHKDRPKNCTPERIVILIRHGSRHPGEDETDIFESFVELAKKVNITGNAEMCQKDLQKIQKWKNWHVPSLHKDLAVTGVQELQGLAQRFSKTFPEIFSGENLDSTKHRFISSNTRRTTQSADAFINRLYLNSTKTRPTVEINDELIKFYDYCKKYLREIDNNDTVTEDVDTFMEGPIITRIADMVARRLGIPRNDITNELVDEIRKEGCAEEEWATGQDSVWCKAFTKEDLQAFEYGEDMDDYLEKSFGHKINHRQSCKLKDLIVSFLKESLPDENNKDNIGLFGFGHSTTMMSLLTEMRLIRDEGRLGSDEYPEKRTRTFRASIYTPGAANIAFVVYKCAENERKIQIFLNEKLIRMPLDHPTNDPDGLWDLEELVQYFDGDDTCNWDDICENEEQILPTVTSQITGNRASISIGVVVLVVSILLLVLVGAFVMIL